MAPRKKMSGTDTSAPKGEPQQEVAKKEVKKPFKIDQDKDTKFRYEYKNWEEYHKYKGPKG